MSQRALRAGSDTRTRSSPDFTTRTMRLLAGRDGSSGCAAFEEKSPRTQV
jgi:hypothetical protein